MCPLQEIKRGSQGNHSSPMWLYADCCSCKQYVEVQTIAVSSGELSVLRRSRKKNGRRNVNAKGDVRPNAEPLRDSKPCRPMKKRNEWVMKRTTCSPCVSLFALPDFLSFQLCGWFENSNFTENNITV